MVNGEIVSNYWPRYQRENVTEERISKTDGNEIESGVVAVVSVE